MKVWLEKERIFSYDCVSDLQEILYYFYMQEK